MEQIRPEINQSGPEIAGEGTGNRCIDAPPGKARPPNPHQTLRNQKTRGESRKPGGNRGKGKVQSARGNRGIVSCLERHHRFRLRLEAADALSLRRGRPARGEKGEKKCDPGAKGNQQATELS